VPDDDVGALRAAYDATDDRPVFLVVDDDRVGAGPSPREVRQMVTSKPVILVVDDQPDDRRALSRDLRRRYGGDYRILSARSGAAAPSSPSPAG
jgi:hypothetical protein